jgi:hypothetical protein
MKKKILLVTLLVTWGVLTRTILHVGPNVEFITSISLISGFLFHEKRLAILVPLLAMFISDTYLGNTGIFIFTWSGFLFPVLLGMLLTKFNFNLKKLPGWLKLGFLTLNGAIISTLFFFVWTNFGHWLTTNMYTKDLNGLTQCYVNALPFLRNQLAGNLIFAPLLMLAVVWGFNYLNLRKSALKLNNSK